MPAGLIPQRGQSRFVARMLQEGQAIPDVADYDVVLTSKNTRVGQLDEGCVEELREGDVFLLGSTSWRVRRCRDFKTQGVRSGAGVPWLLLTQPFDILHP